jgi:hypothetical protein
MSVVHLPVLSQISEAIKTLNPREVRAQAELPLQFGVLAADDGYAASIFSFLVPAELSQERARETGLHVLRIADEADFRAATLGLAEPGVPHPAHFYTFERDRQARVISRILDEHEEHAVALARWFPAFRGEAIERIIWKVSKENALFAVATAIPNVVPSFLTAPWAVGEFASDTAVLTMNQVRMAFLIAAASDVEVGYDEQKGQIGSIVAAAFGWRALARELVGKIPAGGGLLSKGLVGFAGTYAVGKGLERFFRFGERMTRRERKEHYHDAYERGRSVVQEIIQRLRRSRDQIPA